MQIHLFNYESIRFLDNECPENPVTFSISNY